MKFVDEATIHIKAGDGGNGCVSFRREKFVPRGGPNGGSGGKGGDVVIRASRSHRTLLDLKLNPRHLAGRGSHGEGSLKTGKDGRDEEILVPVGTIVRDAATGDIIADLAQDGAYCIAARGGRGGKGNAHFKSSTHQAPRFAQDGEPGEEWDIDLELKLLADVGIIGLPNVGKSTLISRISAARPKIADYPFTTLRPNLGVVKTGNYKSFVIADIPGLIEGAHQGMGLGIRFLRHVERTSMLIHMLDISKDGAVTAWHDFETVNGELKAFNTAMMDKPQIVVINKTDLPVTRERLAKETKAFTRRDIPVIPISAVTGEGIKELIAKVAGILKSQEAP